MTKIELINKQVKDAVEDETYYRVYELLEYHYNLEDVQNWVQQTTKRNQTGNSAKACYNNLMQYLMKGGKL